MTCGICKRIQRDGNKPTCPGIEGVPECPDGAVPKLDEALCPFVEFFNRIACGVFDGMGGARLESINTGMEMSRVPEAQREGVFDMCLAAIHAVGEAREANRENGGPAQT